MNRILLTPDDVGDGGVVRLVGRRARHILDVLQPSPGDTLRVGMVNGPTGDAAVGELGKDRVVLGCRWHAAPPPAPRVSLLLALPRPKVMRRLWAPLAMLGLSRIILTNAAKVERHYFDTHWLEAVTYRPLMLEGLEQSGDTHLPDVLIHRRLKPLVEDELDGIVPHGVRLLAHPQEADGPRLSIGPDAAHVLIAVGPEGGWTGFELDLLREHAFEPFSLGWRRLKTDVACIALISVVQAAIGERGEPHG